MQLKQIDFILLKLHSIDCNPRVNNNETFTSFIWFIRHFQPMLWCAKIIRHPTNTKSNRKSCVSNNIFFFHFFFVAIASTCFLLFNPLLSIAFLLLHILLTFLPKFIEICTNVGVGVGVVWMYWVYDMIGNRLQATIENSQLNDSNHRW